MNCRYCDVEYPDDVRTCQRCGATLRAATTTALRLPGELVSLDPSVDATIKPVLANKLDAWSVSSRDAKLAIHLMGRNYPLGHLSQLRSLLEDGLIRPDTPVLHQKRGRWFEAARFPGISSDGEGFHAENTGQFDDKTPGMAIDEAKPSTVEGRAVLAARLGREAEEAASAGEIERAISIYEEIIQINPRYPLAKKRLRQLKATLEAGDVIGGVPKASDAARPARLLLPAHDPSQHEEMTAALSVDDLVDGEIPEGPVSSSKSLPPPIASLPPPPPPKASSPRGGAPSGTLRHRTGGVSHGTMVIPSRPTPPAFSRGRAQPIGPDDDSVVTAQEEVLEPTAFLDDRDDVDLHGEEMEPTRLLPVDDVRPPAGLVPSHASSEELTAQELVFEDTPVDSFGAAAPVEERGGDPFLYVRDVDAVDWVSVAAFYEVHFESREADMPRDAAAIKRLFAASQRFCLLYTEGELVGGIRVITDGVAVATLCDLALASVEHVSIVAASLIAAALKDLDVSTVILLAPAAYAETMKMLDFDGHPHLLVRRGAVS